MTEDDLIGVFGKEPKPQHVLFSDTSLPTARKLSILQQTYPCVNLISSNNTSLFKVAYADLFTSH